MRFLNRLSPLQIFFHFKSDIKYFLQTLLTNPNSHSPQSREIPRRRSLGQVKIPFEIRHFVETKFSLRRDRSTHSVSINSMHNANKLPSLN